MKGYTHKPDETGMSEGIKVQGMQENQQDVSVDEANQKLSDQAEEVAETQNQPTDETASTGHQETHRASDVANEPTLQVNEATSVDNEDINKTSDHLDGTDQKGAFVEENRLVDDHAEAIDEQEASSIEDSTQLSSQLSSANSATSSRMDDVAETPDSVYDLDPVADAPAQGWRFLPPSRSALLTGLAFWGVILLAAVLRFMWLDNKPLHHDESLHAYFSRQLLLNNIENWQSCWSALNSCYRYDPLTHGPFQFHATALVYKISQFLGVPDHGANGYTARIVAATLGTALVGLPYFLRHYLGKLGAWLACFLLAVSPSMVYFSRFTREDIYMAFFTLLLVVGTAEYMRTRKIGWFIAGVLGFVLSYATKEATFLTIAIFGSFFAVLAIWEIGGRWRFPFSFAQSNATQDHTNTEVESDTSSEAEGKNLDAMDNQPGESVVSRQDNAQANSLFARLLPRTMAPVLLLACLGVFGLVAKFFFDWLKGMATMITENPTAGESFIGQVKQVTILFVPWVGILLAVVVGILLYGEHVGIFPTTGRHGLAKRVDPKKQPLLDAIVTMPWTHWFFGFVVGWTVFTILFTALFTYLPNGIADGIWQGLYYWLAQQEVARGGQPWYYYLMLLPLYEVVGLLFGIVGIVYALYQPSRFRLFLIWWFFGNLAIYSWASEKMPWLMIHMTLPLVLLAAIGLRQIALTLWQGVRDLNLQERMRQQSQPSSPRRGNGVRIAGGLLGIVLAVFTLVISLQNMVQVSYVHPAGAQYEMMIYVQTTPHVEETMRKIEELDREYSGGQRTIPIGVMNGEMWPYVWYLRDYTAVCLGFQIGAQCQGVTPPVIIADPDRMADVQMTYGDQYNYQIYEMRAQWNQGYMPVPCNIQEDANCEPAQYGGVGPLPWLSYGNNPPTKGAFDPGLIVQNTWRWWWTRTPFGGLDTGYQFILALPKASGIVP